jgi:hypothetical protein
MFNELRWAVIVPFVDVGLIVDHHDSVKLNKLKSLKQINNFFKKDSGNMCIQLFS